MDDAFSQALDSRGSTLMGSGNSQTLAGAEFPVNQLGGNLGTLNEIKTQGVFPTDPVNKTKSLPKKNNA